MTFWVLRFFLLNPGHLYSTVLGGYVASASCWACQQYPGQSRALNHWACGRWWGGSSAPCLAQWHPPRGKWGTASLPLSEGMKSDSPKPHCQQGGRSRGLTQNALLLGWGWEVHLNCGPCWHCPGALPSSALKGMEGQQHAQLFWHCPTEELKCTVWFQGEGWEIHFQLGPVDTAGVWGCWFWFFPDVWPGERGFSYKFWSVPPGDSGLEVFAAPCPKYMGVNKQTQRTHAMLFFKSPSHRQPFLLLPLRRFLCFFIVSCPRSFV